jgi:hypothetical protein
MAASIFLHRQRCARSSHIDFQKAAVANEWPVSGGATAQDGQKLPVDMRYDFLSK